VLADLLPVWTITCLDISGTSTTTRGTFAGGFEASDYLTALATLVGLLGGVTDCAIVRYAVTFRAKDSDPGMPRSALPPPNQARLVFQLSSDASIYESVLIPLKSEWVDTSGPLAGFGIDITQSDIDSLGDAITDGLFTNPFADDIGVLVSAHVEMTV